jgi:hypothetical protein
MLSVFHYGSCNRSLLLFISKEVAYNISTPFNPQRNFSFNPVNDKENAVGNISPNNVQDNPYVPTCANQESTMITNHHQQVRSYVNQFGQTISYQPVKYNFNTHNFLYGEDPTSGYHYARKLKAIVDFKSYTTFLTKFGIMSDAELIIYIPIQDFEAVWGPSKGVTFPLAGDLFIIDNSSCDRPLGQTAMCWEVIDKDDKINPTDFMGRHFYWKLTCKRFDYSYEPGVTPEKFLDQTSGDSAEFGRLSGGVNPEEMGTGSGDADSFAKSEFDQPKNSIYGDYL